MKYILVVDDELDILETIVDTLEIEFDESDVQIDKAVNGIEALKLFNGEINYDLVVTDLNMPEMDGIELTENIKKINDKTPVIVFTGHGDIEEQEKLTSLGVLAMIKKPYVEDLIEEVTNSIK
ncbi:MAG: CheY-like chemotaxis protein [Bacteriovoracaceae bacterium]|jgi:CheY-like chemotaxis protein